MFKSLFERVYDVLVTEAGASPTPHTKAAFVEHFSALKNRRSGNEEWRFQGALGFGGKFWGSSDGFRVSCYVEDENRARKKCIRLTNKALQPLFDEYRELLERT